MNALTEYLTEKLTELLEKRRVVVWYDAKAEFADYVAGLGALAATGTGLPEVAAVQVGALTVNFARFEGSFFGLKFAVEPLFAVSEPAPLLLFLPGVEHDAQESVLMEIEKAGEVFEPQLKRTVRHVLKPLLSDGEIDEIIERPSLTYADVVSLLGQGGSAGTMSIVKVIFAGSSDSASLLAAWLADDDHDMALNDKQGEAELFKLIRSRLGLDLDNQTPLSEARDKTLRFVLVNEFRSDLQAAPPESISRIPKPTLAEELVFCRKVAESLREKHAARYAALADRVEQGLGLAEAKLNAELLGAVDTFRFEERALLTWCGQLVHNRTYTKALEVVQGRSPCFWVRHDVNRQAQWEACRLMAELGRKTNAVLAELPKVKGDSAALVKAYVEGWSEADQLHRHLESWVAKMPSDPETDQALVTVRGDYEGMLREQSAGFAKAFQAAGWTVPGVLAQSHIYHEVVKPGTGPVAYFLVDALRFEMGAELARLLGEAQEMSLRPAVAALPSITPMGMAALLPGAESSFSVVEHKGKLAARVDGAVLSTWQERWKYLKGRVPDAVELTLGKVQETTVGRLTKAIDGASLVVVRSQELDLLGESGDGSLARQWMDTVLVNLARAVRKLAAAGVARFVIVADHGHLFAEERGGDMQTDNPGGQTLEIKRRCWVGRGGQTPPSTVRVAGSQLGYESDLEFVFPTGMGVLPAHDGLQYHHGGFALQELIIPVLSFRMAIKTEKKATARVVLSGVPSAITNRMFSVTLEAPSDLLAEPLAVRVVLMEGEEIVGQVGMALEAELDRDKGILRLLPGQPASLGVMLSKEGCDKVKLAVLNAATDALLAQSDELPVRLAI